MFPPFCKLCFPANHCTNTAPGCDTLKFNLHGEKNKFAFFYFIKITFSHCRSVDARSQNSPPYFDRFAKSRQYLGSLHDTTMAQRAREKWVCFFCLKLWWKVKWLESQFAFKTTLLQTNTHDYKLYMNGDANANIPDNVGRNIWLLKGYYLDQICINLTAKNYFANTLNYHHSQTITFYAR